jgi:hypothetical protein
MKFPLDRDSKNCRQLIQLHSSLGQLRKQRFGKKPASRTFLIKGKAEVIQAQFDINISFRPGLLTLLRQHQNRLAPVFTSLRFRLPRACGKDRYMLLGRPS